jgi:hypothetical protein
MTAGADGVTLIHFHSFASCRDRAVSLWPQKQRRGEREKYRVMGQFDSTVLINSHSITNPGNYSSRDCSLPPVCRQSGNKVTRTAFPGTDPENDAEVFTPI